VQSGLARERTPRGAGSRFRRRPGARRESSRQDDVIHRLDEGWLRCGSDGRRSHRPALLELGGKNAFLVFDDADVDRAVRDALEGGFYNKGEACTAASRVIVQKSVAVAFTNQLAARVNALRVGAGNDPTTHVGPVVTKAQQSKVLEYIEVAARRRYGCGRRPTAVRPGVSRWLLCASNASDGVPPSARLFQEEIFGPVVTVTTFDTEEEAVEIANATEYGLFAGLYTRDSERALRVARRIDVGVVLINNYFRGILGLPFAEQSTAVMPRAHH